MFIEKARKLAYNRTSWQGQWQWSLRFSNEFTTFTWRALQFSQDCRAFIALWNLLRKIFWYCSI